MDLVCRCNNLHHSFVTEDKMAFWSKWFSSSQEDSTKAVKSLDYKGFLIEAQPYKEAISKGQLIVDQMGEAMFRS
jgi:hypothetical protein